MQGQNAVSRETAGQQRGGHRGLVSQHSGFAGVGCNSEEGEMAVSIYLSQHRVNFISTVARSVDQ